MRSALRAGTPHANRPTNNMMPEAPSIEGSMSMIGSLFPSAAIIGRSRTLPTAMPRPTCVAARAKTAASTARELAPKASRMPISLVRRVTATDMSEYNDAADNAMIRNVTTTTTDTAGIMMGSPRRNT